jgi:3-deoxy-manno-octulosonate cytidylyltransferase (CMP-KDO synthetase)
MTHQVNKIVCIIPARLKATRFPGKMLASIAGKPLLQWVWDAATKVPYFNDIMFATDTPIIAEHIQQFGGRYVMTSEQCAGGTDRLVEIMQSGKVTADIWINWQGDEPFITTQMIAALIQTCEQDTCDIWTLKKRITDPAQVTSANVAKVVCDARGYALYFSRSPIPFYRDLGGRFADPTAQVFYKHIGLYAFTTSALKKIATMGQSSLEDAEKLEQLRWLHYGLSIRVHETDRDVKGIDTPQDLAQAEAYAATLKH